MAFWKRRAVTLEDSVFGRIVLGKYGWEVEDSELQSNLIVFADDLTAALYNLYEPYLRIPDWEGPRPESARALRDMLYLSCVTYLEDATPEFLFAFKGDLWPDAMFIVEIRDGKVRAVARDD